MFHKHLLEPITPHDHPLEFEWNPLTGELRGKDAVLVTSLCRQAEKQGWVTGHPYPTDYPVSDPLHRPTEMAIVLGQYWRLDAVLGAAYPQ